MLKLLHFNKIVQNSLLGKQSVEIHKNTQKYMLYDNLFYFSAQYVMNMYNIFLHIVCYLQRAT